MNYKVSFYHVCDGNVWIITRHNIVHNHPFTGIDETYLLHAHRQISEQNLKHSKLMREYGITISDIIGLSKKKWRTPLNMVL